MIANASNSSSNSNSNSNSSSRSRSSNGIVDSFEVFDALEESIISSIRTAGIPQKAREISIVDKMMDLRR